MKKILLRTASAVATTAGCLLASVGVASAGTISNTGPWSYNAMNSRYNTNTQYSNHNNIYVGNHNYQNAITGSAYVYGNSNTSHNNHHDNDCDNTQNHGGNYWQSSWYPSYSHSQWMPHVYYTSYHYDRDHDRYQNRLSNHYAQMMNYWPISNHDYHNSGYGGYASTGNASNYNNTHATVVVHNSAPSYNYPSSHYNSYSGNTGPHSYTTVNNRVNNSFTENNTNNISLTNTNNQYARSGDAIVSGNTHGGTATTGDASNYNSTNETVTVHNNAPNLTYYPMNMSQNYYGGNHYANSGPRSYSSYNSQVNNTYRVQNMNDIRLVNTNNQYARSGDAIVSGNTHGGTATTGDASNYNSTSFNVNVTNN